MGIWFLWESYIQKKFAPDPNLKNPKFLKIRNFFKGFRIK